MAKQRNPKSVAVDDAALREVMPVMGDDGSQQLARVAQKRPESARCPDRQVGKDLALLDVPLAEHSVVIAEAKVVQAVLRRLSAQLVVVFHVEGSLSIPRPGALAAPHNDKVGWFDAQRQSHFPMRIIDGCYREV
jgi:hypothetical protein